MDVKNTQVVRYRNLHEVGLMYHGKPCTLAEAMVVALREAEARMDDVADRTVEGAERATNWLRAIDTMLLLYDAL